MPEIENDGTYNVTIDTWRIKMLDKNDDPHAFIVKVKGVTADGYWKWGDIWFTSKTISSGKNAKRTTVEVSEELLEQLGVDNGYLGAIDAAIDKGLKAEFVLKWDEWEGKKTLKVAWINPPNRLLSPNDVDLDALLGNLKGNAPAPIKKADPQATRAAQTAEQLDNSEIPF